MRLFEQFNLSHLSDSCRLKMNNKMYAGDYGDGNPTLSPYYTGRKGFQNYVCYETPHNSSNETTLNSKDTLPLCQNNPRGGKMTNPRSQMACTHDEINENQLTNQNHMMNTIGKESIWSNKITLRGSCFQEEDKREHMCSFKHCEFKYIPQSDVYICIESRNYHICDDKCELAISSDIEWGYLVCPLSGKMFDCLSQPQCRKSFKSVDSSVKYILTYDMGNDGAFQYISPQEENYSDSSYAQEVEPSFAYRKRYSHKRMDENRAHEDMRRRVKRRSEKKKSGRIPPVSKNSIFKKILDSYMGRKRDCKRGSMRNG